VTPPSKENDWAFHYMPKRIATILGRDPDNMYALSQGNVRFRDDGVAYRPDSQRNIDALKKADWLVVGEIYPDETSEFWKSPGSRRRR